MDKKIFIEIYNENITSELPHLKISSINDLDKFSTDELKILFDLLSDLIAEVEVDTSGNITNNGKLIDEVASQINNIILSRK